MVDPNVSISEGSPMRFGSFLPRTTYDYTTRMATGELLNVVTGASLVQSVGKHVQGLSVKGGAGFLYSGCEGYERSSTCDGLKYRTLPGGAETALTASLRFGGDQVSGIIRIAGATADGSTLILTSSRSDLVPGDTNNAQDIFLMAVDAILN
jgi:hypothetical protein